MEQEMTIQITGREHAEWQGILRLGDGRELPFQSVLELLRAMEQEQRR